MIERVFGCLTAPSLAHLGVGAQVSTRTVSMTANPLISLTYCFSFGVLTSPGGCAHTHTHTLVSMCPRVVCAVMCFDMKHTNTFPVAVIPREICLMLNVPGVNMCHFKSLSLRPS